MVKAENLSKIFMGKDGKTVTALDHIALTVSAGKLTALVGPDGAGKTTLMRLLAGLMDPTEGLLLVDGIEAAKHPQAVQDRISYMPQKFGLYEDLSIQENLNLYADLHGVPQEVRKARFAHLLTMTGLTPFTGRLAGKLSGGMKQKLGLACTLVRSPRLLLLDEPTVGVDPLSRRELWEILKKLTAEERLSVLISTAYMDEAEHCHEVYVINRGRILAAGAPEKLTEAVHDRCYRVQPALGMTTRLLQSELLAESGVIDAVPEAGRVHYLLREGRETPATLTKYSLQAEKAKARFEDAFMALLHADEAVRDGENEVWIPQKREEFGTNKNIVDIEVKDLVKQFGTFTAVSHTSFSVHRGEVFGLLGPNGAGKTTTFRMLCGLLKATTGSLQVAGVDMRKEPERARSQIGYVAQKFSLYETLSVEENLRFFGGAYGLYGAKLRARMDSVMEEFQLTERKNWAAGELPGGYKQRLSMAAALLHEPQILFLDEPTSGIDPLARRVFWQQITRLSAQGTTIIITTHFMDEAEYCDRMMIQDQGKLRILGTPWEVRKAVGLLAASMDDVFVKFVESRREEEEMRA